MPRSFAFQGLCAYELCQKLFVIRPSNSRTGSKRFCSLACWYAANTIAQERLCGNPQCQKVFRPRASSVRQGYGKYCSHTCHMAVVSAEKLAAFWANTLINEYGCLLWQRSKDEHGYGRLTIYGKPEKAHHLAWILTHGPIPDSLCVLHDCPGGDNPSCINPAHLWLGTLMDNSHDMIAKGRWNPRQGEQHYNAKLTADDVRQIRYLATTSMKIVDIARMFTMSPAHIGNIVHRRTWKHI